MLYGPRSAGIPNILISSIIGLTEDEKLESLDWKETKMSVRKAESRGGDAKCLRRVNWRL